MDDILIYVDNLEKIFKTLKIDFMIDLIIFVILVIILYKLIDLFNSNLKNKLKEKNSEMVRFIPALDRTAKGLVLFFMIATFLQSHGYSMASFIAGFGITGLAIGFAAKETIANIFGAISILSDKSYRLGDYINVNGIEGTVEDINMRSTKIRASDNSIIIFPNSMVANSVIKNISCTKRRRILEVFNLTYDTSTEKLQRAIQILEELVQNNECFTKDNFVILEKLDSSSINIKISAYTKTHDYVKFAKIREQLLLDIISKFREESIDFAFPSQSVYIEKK